MRSSTTQFTPMWEFIRKASLPLAAGLFVVVFSSFAIGSLVLTAGGTLGSPLFVISVALSIVSTIALARQSGLELPATVGLVVVLLVVVWGSIKLEQRFYDISPDGTTYHQAAIIQLATGWNPVHQNLKDDAPWAIWINHYPKASWIFAANYFKLGESIEGGKSYNILLCISAALFICSVILSISRISLIGAVVIIASASMNPVAIYQSLSFYVDGALGSTIVSMVALSVLFYRDPSVLLAFLLAGEGILASNIKFTGIPYSVFVQAGLIIALVASRRMRAVKTVICSLLGSLIMGICVFGYHPYVTNFLNNGHIFYPLYGYNSVDIMSAERPRPISDKGKLERFAISLFHSTSHNSTYEPDLKIPFTISRKELVECVIEPDCRLGGWGPLFGGIVILACCSFALLCFLSKEKEAVRLSAFVVTVLLCSVFANPEAWWARYVPQLWLIPIVVSIALAVDRNVLGRMVAVAIAGLMLINSCLIFGSYYRHNYKVSQAIEGELWWLLAKGSMPIKISYGEASNTRRLVEAHVPYEKVDTEDLPCDFSNLVASDIAYCRIMPDN